MYKEALAIHKKVSGEDILLSHRSTILVYCTETKASTTRRKRCTRSHWRFLKGFGEEHPEVAKSLNNLAFLYEHQGKYDEAEKMYKESLAIKKKVYGEEHLMSQQVQQSCSIVL